MAPARTRRVRWLATSLAGLIAAAAAAGDAQASPEACRAAIVKASAAFVQARAKALQKCYDKVVRGKFPATTSCPNDARTGLSIAKAAAKMERAIAKACGGADRTCGTEDDESLADVGWNLPQCPDFQDEGCTGPITSCADVAACLECIGSAAVDQSMALSYESLLPSDPGTDPTLNRCQAAIGKAANRYLATRSKVLAKCWRRVLKGKASAPCPVPGDGAAQEALDAAALKILTAICKACGGDDQTCGGEDDRTTAEIGAPTSCPGVAACGGAIADVASLAQCLECVTAHGADCSDAAAVPGLAAYPQACTLPPNPTGVLDASLPPVFGSTALTSGFVPDPFSVGITAGGPVNASYLGGGCGGHATSAPSFSVNYTAGAFPTLRIYFIGAADTTLIIRSPSETFFCVDDSFGTLHPTIDFISPAGGRYDVWVGTFNTGASVAGTLFVTENVGNHP